MNQVHSERGARSLICTECGAEIPLPRNEPLNMDVFLEAPVAANGARGATDLRERQSTISAGKRPGPRRATDSRGFAGAPVVAVAPSSGHSPALLWWIIGAAGLFLLVIGAGVVVVLMQSARDPQLIQRQGLATEIIPRPVDPAAKTGSSATTAHDDRTQPLRQETVVENNRLTSSPSARTSPTDTKAGRSATSPHQWQAQIDGLAAWVPIPAEHKVEVKIPRNSGADILFPEVPSHFVAVGSNHSERDQREIWNLASNRLVGTISGVRIPSLKTTLSADGRYFAALPLGATAVITLWDVSAGKQLPDLPFNSNGFVRAVWFAGNDRLLAVSGKNECTVWSIPSGKAERIIELSRYLEVDSLALSPGGRYLCFVDDEVSKRRVRVFDLTTGEQAGELPLENSDHRAQTCKTLQYSPDGKELAGVFDGGSTVALLCWDAATGRLRTNFEFEEQVGALGTRQYSRLQWFPDRSRWLMNGHFVLDRREQKIVTSIGTDQLGQTDPCYVLDDRRMLQVHNDRGDRMLISAALPENAIARPPAKATEPLSPTSEGAAAGSE